MLNQQCNNACTGGRIGHKGTLGYSIDSRPPRVVLLSETGYIKIVVTPGLPRIAELQKIEIVVRTLSYKCILIVNVSVYYGVWIILIGSADSYLILDYELRKMSSSISSHSMNGDTSAYERTDSSECQPTYAEAFPPLQAPSQMYDLGESAWNSVKRVPQSKVTQVRFLKPSVPINTHYICNSVDRMTS